MADIPRLFKKGGKQFMDTRLGVFALNEETEKFVPFGWTPTASVDVEINGETHRLNLKEANPFLTELIVEEFRNGDALGFVGKAESNEHALAFVFDNVFPLRARGIYEIALAHAWTGTRGNHCGWPIATFEFLFEMADRAKLKEVFAAEGQPPGVGPFKVYRGVAGLRRQRRIRSFSWTRSRDCACGFAMRYEHLDDPAVYSAVLRREDVYFYSDGRNEQEFVGRPKSCRRLPLTIEEIREGASRWSAAKTK